MAREVLEKIKNQIKWKKKTQKVINKLEPENSKIEPKNRVLLN